MPVFTDTHAHLYFHQFDHDRNAMIQRALNNGVTRLFLPNVDSETIAAMYQTIDAHPHHCFPMMGVHPCSIKANFEKELALAEQELKHSGRRFYAVGEIGLDFYWDVTYRKQQFEALERQIAWAKELQLPIVLHCRESFAETFELVKNQAAGGGLSGVFHCFGGTVADAGKVAALDNFYMGIGGTLTYKKSELPEVIAAVDLQYIVLETDAPYLAPEPYRSAKNPAEKRNESAYVVNVAQRIAEIKRLSIDEVATTTTQNALTLFKMN